MKHKFSFIICFWWVLLLGLLGGMIIWLAPKEERVSEVENRNLAGAPELSMETIIDSSFMTGVESFLADGFFNRVELIEISSNIKNILNTKSAEEMMSGNMEEAVNEFMEEAEQINSEQGDSDFEDDEDILDNQTEEIQDDNQENLSITDNEEYTFVLKRTDGTTKLIYTYPVENLEISINALNAYRQVLPEDGELHFFQIPYGYLANMLIYDKNDKYKGWECDAEDYMQEHAIEGVYIHNGPAILEQHLEDGEKCYFRTDYHWTALGAYYGHEGIMEDMGLPHLKYDDYDYKVYEDFIGAGYAKNPTAEIKAKADRLEILYPLFPMESYTIKNLTEMSEAPILVHGSKTYLAYLGGTLGPYRRIITGADTGRSCIIVTDSFGNVFAPFMFPYYDEIHMVDLRASYFSKSRAGASVKEYIEYYGIDDAYIMLSTSSSMNSGYMLNYLMKYLDY